MINKHPEKDLYLVKYIHLGIDWSIEGALDARGLILDSSGNIIARPYKKFFNYKELDGREDLPEHIRQLSEWEDGEYEVQEKVDGSFIMAFVYDGELIITSSGSFVSEHVELAKKLIASYKNKTRFHSLEEGIINADETAPNVVFLFELVSPRYQIVINYPKEELVLHDILNDGKTIGRVIVERIADNFGIKTPQLYKFTLDELEKAQIDLKGVEGFVIKFKSGKMLKIKTEDYFTKSKDIAIFFGRFFTYRKVGIVVDSIFDDTYDDLVASASTFPKIKESIETVFNFYKEFEIELLGYKAKWDSGEFSDRKVIATCAETKPYMHSIFLSLKERPLWKEPFKQQAFKKFIREV
jgi:tRNA splicing ligase